MRSGARTRRGDCAAGADRAVTDPEAAGAIPAARTAAAQMTVADAAMILVPAAGAARRSWWWRMTCPLIERRLPGARWPSRAPRRTPKLHGLDARPALRMGHGRPEVLESWSQDNGTAGRSVVESLPGYRYATVNRVP